MKSTTEEIRQRFDNDVERFSNLETGQVSTIDSALSLDLITEAAKRVNPDAKSLLDVGCGAGNYTLKMLSKLPGLTCTLTDLSKAMLDRALQRITPATTGIVTAIQGDIREIDLPDNTFDIILAGAVLHHLRDDADWEFVFAKLFRILKDNGCLFISDLVTQENGAINAFIWERYADYLEELGGADYKQKVFDYIDKEDSPRPLTYQLDLMKKVGFRQVEVLHKNVCFAAYGAIK